MSQRSGRGSTTPRRDRLRPNGLVPSPAVVAANGHGETPEPHDDHADVGRYSDVGLVVCIGRHRHPAALGEVFARHGGPAFHLAQGICGPERAEEAVVGVLLDLWRQPRRFDPDRSSLRSFLVSQTHARAADIARAARRASTPLLPGAGRSLDDEPFGPGHGHGELRSEVDGHAGRLLSHLEADEARTLALAYLWGYSCAELAAMLGRSEVAVARSLRAALVGLGNRSMSEDGAVDGPSE